VNAANRKNRTKKRRGREVQSPILLAAMHVRVGWWVILLFVVMGIALEAMHGFKVGWYLNANLETRRTLLMLAHAAGVAIGILHVAFAASIRRASEWKAANRSFASASLLAATLAIPGGLILAAVFLQANGSPGMGVVLAGTGMLLIAAAIAYTAVGMRVRTAE